jgi:hypothetical protein
MQKDDTGQACIMCGTKSDEFTRNMKAIDRLEDLGVSSRIILKWI